MLASYLKYLYFILLAAIPVLIIVRRRVLPTAVWPFVPICFFALLVEAIGHILSPKGINVIPYYHLYQQIETNFLFVYYYLILRQSILKRLVLSMALIYFLANLYWYAIPPSLIFKVVRYEFVLEAILISMLSCTYLYSLYRSDDEADFTNNPHFWINIANLIFYSGDMIFMASRDFLNQNFRDVFGKLSYISYILNLFLYITYIKAFLCSTKEK